MPNGPVRRDMREALNGLQGHARPSPVRSRRKVNFLLTLEKLDIVLEARGICPSDLIIALRALLSMAVHYALQHAT